MTNSMSLAKNPFIVIERNASFLSNVQNQGIVYQDIDVSKEFVEKCAEKEIRNVLMVPNVMEEFASLQQLSLIHHHQIVKKTMIVMMDRYVSMVDVIQNADLNAKGISYVCSMDAWMKLAANMIMIAHTLTGALKVVAFLRYLAELDPCNSVLMEVFNVLIRNVYQESSVKEIETVLAIQSVLKDYALIDVKTKVTVESFKTV